MRKVVTFFLLLSSMLILLSGCYYSHVTSVMCIQNDQGAGRKTIYMDLIKDGANDPSGNPVSGNEDFLPQGPEAVADWLEQHVPPGFETGLIEEEDRYVFYISYSFTDVDDYNAKTKLLIGAARWDAKGLRDAQMKITDEEGFYHVTFTEDTVNTVESAMVYFEQIYNNPSLFDPHGYSLEDTRKLVSADINIGYKTTQFDLEADPEIAATGLVRKNWTECGKHLKYASMEPFVIKVVDSETGRGIPLVELKTTNNQLYYTDSNGIVAFDEPGLMNTIVFFQIRSHGYIFPYTSFGYRGTAVDITPGGQIVLAMDRVNIAERLYRVTGEGIYNESVKAGVPVPLEEPVLNGRVMGSDSVVTALYKGKLYWFWGDTHGPLHPLGNFRTTGATSELPGQGGLDPSVGVNLHYFTKEDGFVKEMVPKLPGDPNLVWIGGLLTVPDENGIERLAAGYAQLSGFDNVTDRGVIVWDDEEEQFTDRYAFNFADPNDEIKSWQRPGGQATLYTDGGQEYWLFADPLPFKRVRATLEDVIDQQEYEAFTPLMPGTQFDGTNTQLERDANGNLVYAWKKNTPPLTQDQEKQLINAHLMTEQEAMFQFKDIDTGNEVLIAASSVNWNEYRQKWIMIGQQIFGISSFLGEIWYAEAPSPTGPWTWAKKIVTHDDYSFYNPMHHEYFDQDNGRVIYFEATYTSGFTNATPTSTYDYNQVMYRLELDDPRLGLPW
jgi:hypothetical protein